MAVTETTLYEQRHFPIFQNRMYDSAEGARACPRGDIRLVQDAATGLIYNQAFRPELMTYDPHYQNEQAVSKVFQRHLEQVAELVERHLGRDALIEVGCGKGYFLELLLAHGLDVRGFDPAYEGNHPAIEPRPFDPLAGLTAKGLVLRHVLEHLETPFEFLQQLRDANGGAGLIYIEVPCLEWICQQRAWFDIFYEHVNYFRSSDFRRLFGEVRAAGQKPCRADTMTILESNMTEFEQEVQERLQAVEHNQSLIAAGQAFTRASTLPKYSYNFLWQGRPIIQYPQDIVAMQELIWQIKPDLIIETGIAHGGSLIPGSVT